jgi:ABC-type Fe3+-siderophore transport system permease subunit
MIEIAHMLFVYTPIELRVIIITGLIGGIYFIYKEGKNNDR